MRDLESDNPSTSNSVLKLQLTLHAKAKAEAVYRFYVLYDNISREHILARASAQCRSNKGATGIDGAVAKAKTNITALIQRTLETVSRTDTTEVTAFTDGRPRWRTVLANVEVTKPPILEWFHIATRC